MWREHWMHQRTPLDMPYRREFVRARLLEGFTAEQLIEAIKGAYYDRWFMGKDPETNGKSWRGLEHLLKDAQRVERFRETWWNQCEGERQRRPPPKRPPARELPPPTPEELAAYEVWRALGDKAS